MHRYRNKREGTRFEAMASILPEDAVLEAEILGKALRFGAMLWMSNSEKGAWLVWRSRKKHLTLRLSQEAAPLYGEVAEARFLSLVKSLGAEAQVEIGPARANAGA